ncbi:hypothetical protein [Rathayibacter rathayi]|uniref:hypothetical protein n=1 Tax=Rathayibacter rathayi TaxID=33887 RepID=UPI0011B0AB44|nr:hypothetical protein [Rathayibacter rathayi]
MRGERPLETLARQIVRDVLGARVEQHDDNSRDSMVDAKIHLAGAEIPLEVVMDAAPAVMKQAAKLDRYRNCIPLPAGSHSWFVMMVRGSRTSRLASKLPPLLAAIDPAEELKMVPQALAELGVQAIASAHIDSSSAIILFSRGCLSSAAAPISTHTSNSFSNARPMCRTSSTSRPGLAGRTPSFGSASAAITPGGWPSVRIGRCR